LDIPESQHDSDTLYGSANGFGKLFVGTNGEISRKRGSNGGSSFGGETASLERTLCICHRLLGDIAGSAKTKKDKKERDER
jgi:hypothetical protein